MEARYKLPPGLDCTVRLCRVKKEAFWSELASPLDNLFYQVCITLFVFYLFHHTVNIVSKYAHACLQDNVNFVFGQAQGGRFACSRLDPH